MLNGHRQPLSQICGCISVTRLSSDSSPKVLHKRDCARTKNTCWFDWNWNETMRVWQVRIFHFLSDLCLCGHLPGNMGGNPLIRLMRQMCRSRWRPIPGAYQLTRAWLTHRCRLPSINPLRGLEVLVAKGCYPAEERALQMMSFRAACLKDLPLLYLQLNPCLPVESTSWPQLQHWWGLQSGVPKRSPTAILIESSSSRRPTEESGRAFNQAPDSLREAANSRALSSLLWAPFNWHIKNFEKIKEM